MVEDCPNDALVTRVAVASIVHDGNGWKKPAPDRFPRTVPSPRLWRTSPPNGRHHIAADLREVRSAASANMVSTRSFIPWPSPQFSGDGAVVSGRTYVLNSDAPGENLWGDAQPTRTHAIVQTPRMSTALRKLKAQQGHPINAAGGRPATSDSLSRKPGHHRPVSAQQPHVRPGMSYQPSRRAAQFASHSARPASSFAAGGTGWPGQRSRLLQSELWRDEGGRKLFGRVAAYRPMTPKRVITINRQTVAQREGLVKLAIVLPYSAYRK